MLPANQKLVEEFKNGEWRALTKLISLSENGHPDAIQALEAVATKNPSTSHIVGVTGPPGAGKSSLINFFIEHGRRAKQKIAVLAVDPTSPISGGAVLGDRIRLSDHFNDPNVFIRSVSTRGQLGGISLATPQSIALCEAFPFDWLYVESVGVGQNEYEIRRWTDVTVLVLTPDSGDGIQAIKAGVLEVADIIVINKNEGGRGEALYHELEATFREAGRKMPVLCLTSEKDLESRNHLGAAISHWFADNQVVCRERRAAFAKHLCDALVTGYLLELARKWAGKQDFSKVSPYSAFKKFQKTFPPERFELS